MQDNIPVRVCREAGGIFLKKDAHGRTVLWVCEGMPDHAAQDFLCGLRQAKTLENFATCLGEKCQEDMTRIMQSAAGHLRVPMPRLVLQSRKGFYAWYAWREETVYVHPKLLTKPEQAVENVLCHEMVHILHHDHRRAFWETLTALLPTWAIGEGILRAEGYRQ